MNSPFAYLLNNKSTKSLSPSKDKESSTCIPYVGGSCKVKLEDLLRKLMRMIKT